MINNKFHINSQYCGYKTTKAVGTKTFTLYNAVAKGFKSIILYRNTYLCWRIFLLQWEKINARCVTKLYCVSVLFWENKCKASSKLVREKLCHFYYFKQRRVMFLFSDIISTQKLMDFLTQFSNKKLVCFRHFFLFSKFKVALQLYKF